MKEPNKAFYRDAFNAHELELSLISAITGHRYLDPPDGGSVSLADQVGRMANERDDLRRALELIASHQDGCTNAVSKWMANTAKAALKRNP